MRPGTATVSGVLVADGRSVISVHSGTGGAPPGTRAVVVYDESAPPRASPARGLVMHGRGVWHRGVLFAEPPSVYDDAVG